MQFRFSAIFRHGFAVFVAFCGSFAVFATSQCPPLKSMPKKLTNCKNRYSNQNISFRFIKVNYLGMTSLFLAVTTCSTPIRTTCVHIHIHVDKLNPIQINRDTGLQSIATTFATCTCLIKFISF